MAHADTAFAAITQPHTCNDNYTLLLSYRQAVIEKVLQQDKNLTQETNRHWTEICSGAYTFDRREQTAAVLKTLTLQQILEFMDEFVVSGAAKRRAFCSQVKHQYSLSILVACCSVQ
jgi:secreted Zn-dependent insulinase-like peptidase